MADDQNELSIRSRHGMLRDSIPIYSLFQLALNLLVLGLLLWLILPTEHFPTVAILPVMLGWVFQFVSRPSVMTVTKEQAAWLEAVLEAQGFYEQSESDGRWRLTGKQWWQRWPHQHIAFAPGARVTVTAPRDVMESIRDSIELLEEQGELTFAQEEQPFAFQPPEPEALSWHAHVPSAVLGTTCVIAFFWQTILHGSEGMGNWGVSGSALAQGRFETIVLHMFAHGGAMHLTMNMSALAAFGGTLTARLGPTPLNWLRFLLLFFLCGLAGEAFYLVLHPTGTVPMVGASGALYGLLGLLVRAPRDGDSVLSVKSTRIRRVSWDLVKQNAFLFALLAVIAWSSGSNGGLAWEAHLGGFLFGLLVGPKFLPRAKARPAPSATLVTEGSLNA